VDRAQKAELVSELKGVFDKTGLVVVTHYTGLSVAELTDLRVQMRGVGAQFRVTKNRLTKLALEGTKCESIAHLFTGPTAIAYSDDPVAAAKVSIDYAKKNDKLVVLGGVMGNTELDANGVKALATLPSLDELRAKLLGLINAPATKVAGVLQAPAGQLARVFGAYGNSEAA
jgi:large subunit ribosomal protein L10